jgi:hypothetical protein
MRGKAVKQRTLREIHSCPIARDRLYENFVRFVLL